MQVSRITDICSGHGGFPPRECLTGSLDVFVNNLGAASIGDTYNVHCDDDSCHMGTIVGSSPSVFVNGKGLTRVGDMINCGSTVLTGSNNVFAG